MKLPTTTSVVLLLASRALQTILNLYPGTCVCICTLEGEKAWMDTIVLGPAPEAVPQYAYRGQVPYFFVLEQFVVEQLKRTRLYAFSPILLWIQLYRYPGIYMSNKATVAKQSRSSYNGMHIRVPGISYPDRYSYLRYNCKHVSDCSADCTQLYCRVPGTRVHLQGIGRYWVPRIVLADILWYIVLYVTLPDTFAGTLYYFAGTLSVLLGSITINIRLSLAANKILITHMPLPLASLLLLLHMCILLFCS